MEEYCCRSRTDNDTKLKLQDQISHRFAGEYQHFLSIIHHYGIINYCSIVLYIYNIYIIRIYIYIFFSYLYLFSHIPVKHHFILKLLLKESCKVPDSARITGWLGRNDLCGRS